MQVYRPDIFKESTRQTNKMWLDKNENINNELLNFVKKKCKINKRSALYLSKFNDNI